MDAGMKCIKYLLFIFNLIFALSGITLIVIGAVMKALYATYLDFLGHQFISVPMLFIVIGIIIFLVAFFGCCGAIRENHCMTTTFSVLLGLIFVCELAGGIAAYVLRGQVESIINTNMKASLNNYNVTGYGGVTQTWDIMQHELKCCGVEGYMNWNSTAFSHGTDVPDSCCKTYGENCGRNVLVSPDAPQRIYVEGCLDKLNTKIEHNVGVVSGSGVGVAVIQLIGICFACMLSCAIRRNYQTV